jgi:hypothetical protein
VMDNVKITGPLFDGRAARAVDDFLDEATREIAERGVNEVQARLGQVLQNPTGSYQSKVVTDRASESWTVTDGGAVYGPWLEGTSSRNQSTRFRGYQTFRKIRQELEGKVEDIADPILDRHLSRMGGHG